MVETRSRKHSPSPISFPLPPQARLAEEPKTRLQDWKQRRQTWGQWNTPSILSPPPPPIASHVTSCPCVKGLRNQDGPSQSTHTSKGKDGWSLSDGETTAGRASRFRGDKWPGWIGARAASLTVLVQGEGGGGESAGGLTQGEQVRAAGGVPRAIRCSLTERLGRTGPFMQESWAAATARPAVCGLGTGSRYPPHRPPSGKWVNAKGGKGPTSSGKERKKNRGGCAWAVSAEKKIFGINPSGGGFQLFSRCLQTGDSVRLGRRVH